MTAPTPTPAASDASDAPEVWPEPVQRVTHWLAAQGHPHAPRWLADSARTAQEAADALGVQLGQIAKSVIFRLRAEERAVLVVTAGDRRVDEAKVAAVVGAIGRADAAFVKDRTGFSIGGVSPVAHRHPPLVLIDASLRRFETIWAAGGHPKVVFPLSPGELAELCPGAPEIEVA